MKYYLVFVLIFMLPQYATSQSIKEYPSIQEKAKRTRIFHKNHISDINSDCGAYYNKSTSTLTTEPDCKGKFWMEDFPNFDNPYECVMDFSINEKSEYLKSSYLLQIYLGNSSNGYTWLGVNSSGELTISYTDRDGNHDLLLVSNAARVELNKKNHLKFVQFPDGIFYVELNSYKRWSYELPEVNQKIPLVGLSNRMIFNANIQIFNLELNTFKLDLAPTFMDELEIMASKLQQDILSGYDTDEEKLAYNKSMYFLNGTFCSGNCENGYGVYMFEDSYQYIGNWKNGREDGQGKFYHKGELFYDGEFKKGKKEGYGTYHFDNGARYVGYFKDDQRHGQGTLYNSNRKKIKSGKWENGEFVETVYKVNFKNECNKKIKLLIRVLNSDSEWETKGWFTADAGETIYVANTENKIVYYYASTVTKKKKKIVWRGSNYRSFKGEQYGFEKWEIDQDKGIVTNRLRCK